MLQNMLTLLLALCTLVPVSGFTVINRRQAPIIVLIDKGKEAIKGKSYQYSLQAYETLIIDTLDNKQISLGVLRAQSTFENCFSSQLFVTLTANSQVIVTDTQLTIV